MGFLDLFSRKELMDAKLFCELNPYIEHVELVGRFNTGAGDNSRKIYGLSIAKYIGPQFKVSEPFEAAYDAETKTVYCITPDCGYLKFSIDGYRVKVATSDIVSEKATVAGKIPVKMAQPYDYDEEATENEEA